MELEKDVVDLPKVKLLLVLGLEYTATEDAVTKLWTMNALHNLSDDCYRVTQ